jgi:hypothetical protein
LFKQKGVNVSSFRTDRNNNPVAFTTDIAKQAGLVLDTDYTEGEPFANGRFHTAKLLGDPIEITIRVIDRIGFFTASGTQRWAYIALPNADWNKLSFFGKREIIHMMYHQEGGKELEHLFAAPAPHGNNPAEPSPQV